jgi:hypothetical protein
MTSEWMAGYITIRVVGRTISEGAGPHPRLGKAQGKRERSLRLRDERSAAALRKLTRTSMYITEPFGYWSVRITESKCGSLTLVPWQLKLELHCRTRMCQHPDWVQ